MKKYQSIFNPRQYMVSKDFEIFYYDDTNLSNVKSHSHNYYEFYFFLQGKISMQIADRSFPLKSGDVLLIPPGISHHLINQDEKTPYRRFIFWVSREYFEALKSVSDDFSYIIDQAVEQKNYLYHNGMGNFNELHSKCYRLLEETHTDRFGKDSILALCVNDLMLHLNRMAYENLHPVKQKENQSLYINLMQYIEEHLEEDLSLDSLADEFYVSKYHIAHIFKENLGMSIHQYITKKRLDMCRNALLSGTNISKSFQTYGFKDYSSFFRAFRKEYGISPKEYKDVYSLSELNSKKNTD